MFTIFLVLRKLPLAVPILHGLNFACSRWPLPHPRLERPSQAPPYRFCTHPSLVPIKTSPTYVVCQFMLDVFRVFLCRCSAPRRLFSGFKGLARTISLCVGTPSLQCRTIECFSFARSVFCVFVESLLFSASWLLFMRRVEVFPPLHASRFRVLRNTRFVTCHVKEPRATRHLWNREYGG